MHNAAYSSPSKTRYYYRLLDVDLDVNSFNTSHICFHNSCDTLHMGHVMYDIKKIKVTGCSDFAGTSCSITELFIQHAYLELKTISQICTYYK